MEVLIVSKTRMAGGYFCVGGLVLQNNRFVRLMDSNGYNQPSNTPFQIGQIYDLAFHQRREITLPHREDVIVDSLRFLRVLPDISSVIINSGVPIYRGHIDQIFNGLIKWKETGTGFIPYGGQLPVQSVGFWIPDKDLYATEFDSKVRYGYPNGSNYRNLSYVGNQVIEKRIPAGTLIRISLSRLYPKPGTVVNTPSGFYLQLSGWYENSGIIQQTSMHVPWNYTFYSADYFDKLLDLDPGQRFSKKVDSNLLEIEDVDLPY
ncbi:MAG: hypothetical protein LPK25_05880 [Cyclobacteriaceae bacterium]|nr:hypothetical protein [Cyclobacteriaceae bacterium]